MLLLEPEEREAVALGVSLPVGVALQLSLPLGVAAPVGLPLSVPVEERELEAEAPLAEAETVVEAVGVARELGLAEKTHRGLATALTLTRAPGAWF